MMENWDGNNGKPKVIHPINSSYLILRPLVLLITMTVQCLVNRLVNGGHLCLAGDDFPNVQSLTEAVFAAEEAASSSSSSARSTTTMSTATAAGNGAAATTTATTEQQQQQQHHQQQQQQQPAMEQQQQQPRRTRLQRLLIQQEMVSIRVIFYYTWHNQTLGIHYLFIFN